MPDTAREYSAHKHTQCSVQKNTTSPVALRLEPKVNRNFFPHLSLVLFFFYYVTKLFPIFPVRCGLAVLRLSAHSHTSPSLIRLQFGDFI